MTNLTTTHPDFTAIKQKQNAAWGSGDYSKIGSTLQLVGEELAEAIDLPVGAKMLDVAAGNGNVSLALARRLYNVTSSDYVGALLERGKARAEAEGLELNFQIADAEALPFEDGAFDGVVSTYGVMFAPNQEAAAAEMNRVCRSGGRIGLANWTPEGFIGQLFKTLGQFVPPPPGVQSPARWGTRDFLEASIRRGCGRDPHDAEGVHVPLSISAAICGFFPHLVWPCAQGLPDLERRGWPAA